MTFPDNTLNLREELARINPILETLRGINELAEITPELQEGENRQLIREFRAKLIRKLLAKVKEVNSKPIA